MVKPSKEARKRYDRTYYEKNKEKSHKASKKWGKDNPEGLRKIRKRSNAKEETKLKREEWIKNNPEKRRITQMKYQKSHRIIKRINRKKYVKKYPEKIRAQQKAGKLKLKKSCQICGDEKRLERHHWRYDKPLLISTLCKRCHTIQHLKKRRKEHR